MSGFVSRKQRHKLFQILLGRLELNLGLLGIALNQSGTRRVIQRTQAVESIDVVGLDFDELKEQSPFELSGGQKRRVAIAGVIVSRPEILILDEPAAGLDPLGKKEILELLHRLHREWCKTVVIVSHDMDEISENCTRAAVFSEGTVKYVLPPRELFCRTEELTALGLDVPLTAKLCAALKARGITIDCDFTTEDFADKVLAYAASHPKREGDA